MVEARQHEKYDALICACHALAPGPDRRGTSVR